MTARAALLALLILAAAPVRADPLVLSLAADRVEVSTSFHGGRVVAFGVAPPGGGVLALELIGPRQDIVVREKGRVLGIWANTGSETFQGVPGFYAYALRPGDAPPPPGVGLPAVAPPGDGPYRAALIAHKQKQALWPDAPTALDDLGGGAWRVDFALPPDVPIGTYTVRAALHGPGGRTLEEERATLRVDHVGLGAAIVRFAGDYAWAYGLLCVMMAALAGWFMSAVSLRRY